MASRSWRDPDPESDEEGVLEMPGDEDGAPESGESVAASTAKGCAPSKSKGSAGSVMPPKAAVAPQAAVVLPSVALPVPADGDEDGDDDDDKPYNKGGLESRTRRAILRTRQLAIENVRIAAGIQPSTAPLQVRIKSEAANKAASIIVGDAHRQVMFEIQAKAESQARWEEYIVKQAGLIAQSYLQGPLIENPSPQHERAQYAMQQVLQSVHPAPDPQPPKWAHHVPGHDYRPYKPPVPFVPAFVHGLPSPYGPAKATSGQQMAGPYVPRPSTSQSSGGPYS